MSIDVEIENAVREVAAELGQPESVAKRLIAWLEDASERDLPHADRVEHLQNLRKAIVLSEN